MRKLLLILLFPLALTGTEKVVSLAPAVTDMIIYLGGEKQLVGISSACDQAAVKGLPAAGDLGKPFVETVLKLRATVIISDTKHPQANWELLEKCGVKVVILPAKKVGDLPENLRKIGKILRLPGAEEKAQKLQTRIGQLRALPKTSRRGVILFSVNPLITCGSESFISEMLALTGVENTAAPHGRGYFIFSPEFLYRSQAEEIFLIGVNKISGQEFLSRPLFQGVPAVKSGKITFLPENKWSRLTPALIDGAEELLLQRH